MNDSKLVQEVMEVESPLMAARPEERPRPKTASQGPVRRVLCSVALWQAVAALLVLGCVVLGCALAYVLGDPARRDHHGHIPCPAADGEWGLVTRGDPDLPDPFHDVTEQEYERLYAFLKQRPELNLADPDLASVSTSSIFIVDLLLPPKQQTLDFLGNNGPRPNREALVIVFRGDKTPPLVEEYRVGPLSNPTYAELVNNKQRRNPVPFTVRPLSGLEYAALEQHVMPRIDEQLGHILAESYGGQLINCTDNCLTFYDAPVGSSLLGDINVRKLWIMFNYPVEYYTIYPLDIGVLVDVSSSIPEEWSIQKVWYSGALYESMEQLAERYSRNPAIPKTKLKYVRYNRKIKSTQTLRGDPQPTTPKRPPVLVEPDGKRYTIKHRHVTYLHWAFDLRLSALTGPQVYDVRFQGQRLVYELGLAEIAVFYAGYNPATQNTDFVDSGALIGTHSKALVPGVDCPESATYLSATFLGEGMARPTTLSRSMCVFEQSPGVPLRRHLSYTRDEGSFYGGMEDTALVVRTIMTIINYDYIVDFLFYQNGVIQTRALATGYILSSFYNEKEARYGFRLDENIVGNIHHHMFHVKADVDIGGLSNRYETLDISTEQIPIDQYGPKLNYNQIRFQRNLKRTELEGVYHYNFNTPKYHIVHNDQMTTEFGVPRAFRLHMSGLAKQLLPEGVHNEATVPWARHQLAVTVRKEEELVSSSPYAMFDSQDPVTSFQRFLADNESIVDQDLVFWATLGVLHIPHTEDLPVTPTSGNHLSLFLLPYNYFPECPSVSSRDNIRIEYATPGNPSDGLRVDRSGNAVNEFCGVETLEDLVRERPDDIMQTKNEDFKFI